MMDNARNRCGMERQTKDAHDDLNIAILPWVKKRNTVEEKEA